MVSLTKTLLVALPLVLGVSATPTNYGLVARQQGSCVPSTNIGTQADCYQKCTDALGDFLKCGGVQSCICNVLDTSLNVVDECVTCGAVFPLVHDFIQNTIIKNLLSCDNYKPPAQTPCETAPPTPSPPVCDPAALAFAADDPAIVTLCVPDPATYTLNTGDLGACLTHCLFAVFRAKECNGLHTCICSALNAITDTVAQCFRCGTLYDEIHGLVEALLIPNLLGCNLDPRPSTTYVICWSDTTTAVLPSGCTSLVPSGTSLATATSVTATTGPASNSATPTSGPVSSQGPSSTGPSTSSPASSDASSSPTSSSPASSNPASSASASSAPASSTPVSSASGNTGVSSSSPSKSSAPVSSSTGSSGSCIPSTDIGTQADCYQKCTDALGSFLECAGLQSCICNVLDTSLNVVDECVTCGAVFPLVHDFIQNTIIKNLLSCDNYKPPAQTPCETAIPTPSPPVCDPAAVAFAADDPAIVTLCVPDPATYTQNTGDLGSCLTTCLFAVFRAKQCNGLHACICSALNAITDTVAQCFRCGTLYDEIHGLVEALLIPNLLGCDLDPRPSTTYVICWSDMTTAVLPSGCTSLVPSGTSLATATSVTATTGPASNSATPSSGPVTSQGPTNTASSGGSNSVTGSASGSVSGSASGSATNTGAETVTYTTTDDDGQTVTVTHCPVCEASSTGANTDYTDAETFATPVKTVTITTTNGFGNTIVTTSTESSDFVVVPHPATTKAITKTVTLTTTNMWGLTYTTSYPETIVVTEHPAPGSNGNAPQNNLPFPLNPQATGSSPLYPGPVSNLVLATPQSPGATSGVLFPGSGGGQQSGNNAPQPPTTVGQNSQNGGQNPQNPKNSKAPPGSIPQANSGAVFKPTMAAIAIIAAVMMV